MILPKIRDKRFITIRRGGVLTEADHHLLALWAAECAEHVLHIFEVARPNDNRPRQAIEAARAWVRGEIKMMQARDYAGAAQDAAREVTGVSEAARMAILAAGQAAVVAHVAAHELGAAAYAIRAAMEAVPKADKEATRLSELGWQREQLPEEIRELVLDDMRLRNDICWRVFNQTMKNVLLSADGDISVYEVPDIVAENLEKYCVDFFYKWLEESPDAAKHRGLSDSDGNIGLCFNEVDFIEYLNTWVFPDNLSRLVMTFDGDIANVPKEYAGCNWFNF
jgi:hypothetical protein